MVCLLRLRVVLFPMMGSKSTALKRSQPAKLRNAPKAHLREDAIAKDYISITMPVAGAAGLRIVTEANR
jgi:hypothetical protein